APAERRGERLGWMLGPGDDDAEVGEGVQDGRALWGDLRSEASPPAPLSTGWRRGNRSGTFTHPARTTGPVRPSLSTLWRGTEGEVSERRPFQTRRASWSPSLPDPRKHLVRAVRPHRGDAGAGGLPGGGGAGLAAGGVAAVRGGEEGGQAEGGPLGARPGGEGKGAVAAEGGHHAPLGLGGAGGV